jgi:hypothetical protein
MSETNTELTGLHRKSDLLGETQPGQGRPYPTGPNKAPRKSRHLGRKILGGLAAAAVVVGGIPAIKEYNEIHSKREKSLTDIATARQRAIDNLTESAKGEPVRTLNGKVVLFGGSTLRSSALVRDSSVFGYVPGTVREVVGDGEAVVFNNPLVIENGDIWLQARPASSTPSSIEAFVDDSAYVDATALVHQGLAMVCDLRPDISSVISKDGETVGPAGQPTATYEVVHSITDKQDLQDLESSGLINYRCDDSLKP